MFKEKRGVDGSMKKENEREEKEEVKSLFVDKSGRRKS